MFKVALKTIFITSLLFGCFSTFSAMNFQLKPLVQNFKADYQKIRTANIRSGFLSSSKTPDLFLSEIIPDQEHDHAMANFGPFSHQISKKALQGRILWLKNCPDCEITSFDKGFRLPVRTQVVDLDKDGLKDILVADLGVFNTFDTDLGKIVLLKNQGNEKFEPITILDKTERTACAEAVDLDLDGDLDVIGCIFGHQRGKLLWLEQTKSLEFKQHILDPRAGTIHAFPHDFNGDGYPDIATVLSQEDEEVNLFLNNGKGGFSKKTIFLANNPCFGFSSLELADINKDGKMDILTTNGDTFDNYCNKPSNHKQHGAMLFLNQGNLKFKKIKIGALFAAYAIKAGDFNQDGQMDVVVSSHQDPEIASKASDKFIVVYLNNGDLSFKRQDLKIANFPAITLEVIDLDQNGKLDILSGTFTVSKFWNGHRLAWLKGY